VCSVEDVCYGPAWYNTWCNGECNTSCEFYTHTETSCFTYWIEDGWTPAGGGQTGGQTGGGSTGGSGGYPPPQCPGVAARNGVLPGNCQTGWIPPEGGGMIPPAPIDSILSKYSTAIKPRLDSLFAKSLQLNWEHSMIIVQKGDSIYLKNEKTIQDSISTEINFTLGPGEILLGYVHCHPSSSLNIKDRSAPSGSDVKALSLKLTKNFVQITECGNAAYAMVIEDSAKAKRFLDSLARLELDSRIRDSALKVTGWFSDWQNATLVALKNVLGASSKNGIGLYRTTDPMRKSWIKLN